MWSIGYLDLCLAVKTGWLAVCMTSHLAVRYTESTVCVLNPTLDITTSKVMPCCTRVYLQ